MATVRVQWFSPSANFDALGANFPQPLRRAGTNFTVEGLAFDAGATDEVCCTKFVARSYGSGNLTLQLWWYADTATAGDVVWGAAIAAITPDTDSQDVETDALATQTTVTDTHLGTTAHRIQQCSITISNLDSIAADDLVFLSLRRVSSSGSDTMGGDAILVAAELSYSDT